MTFNHFLIAIFPHSTIISFSGDPIGFFSMAEVFFFLAGCSSYVAYFEGATSPREQSQRRGALIRKIATLCLVELALAATYCAAIGANITSVFFHNGHLSFNISSIPLGLDILPVHILILSFGAIAYSTIAAMRSLTMLKLGVFVWLSTLALHGIFLDSPTGAESSLLYLNPLSFQLLYILGFTTMKAIKSGAFESVASKVSTPAIRNALWGLLLCLFVVRHSPLREDLAISILSSRQLVGPFRLLNCAVICSLLYWLSLRFPLVPQLKIFQRIGQRSLYLFTLSTMAIYLLQPLTDATQAVDNLLSQGCIALMFTLLLFIPSLGLLRPAPRTTTKATQQCQPTLAVGQSLSS